MISEILSFFQFQDEKKINLEFKLPLRYQAYEVEVEIGRT